MPINDTNDRDPPEAADPDAESSAPSPDSPPLPQPGAPLAPGTQGPGRTGTVDQHDAVPGGAELEHNPQLLLHLFAVLPELAHRHRVERLVKVLRHGLGCESLADAGRPVQQHHRRASLTGKHVLEGRVSLLGDEGTHQHLGVLSQHQL